MTRFFLRPKSTISTFSPPGREYYQIYQILSVKIILCQNTFQLYCILKKAEGILSTSVLELPFAKLRMPSANFSVAIGFSHTHRGFCWKKQQMLLTIHSPEVKSWKCDLIKKLAITSESLLRYIPAFLKVYLPPLQKEFVARRLCFPWEKSNYAQK